MKEAKPISARLMTPREFKENTHKRFKEKYGIIIEHSNENQSFIYFTKAHDLQTKILLGEKALKEKKKKETNAKRRKLALKRSSERRRKRMKKFGKKKRK